jgi:hypothetical protein
MRKRRRRGGGGGGARLLLVPQELAHRDVLSEVPTIVQGQGRVPPAPALGHPGPQVAPNLHDDVADGHG